MLSDDFASVAVYKNRDFDPTIQVANLIGTGRPFKTLISAVRSSQHEATRELQKLVFSNYRNYLHISAAVRVVLRDIGALKTVVSETKQTINAISNISIFSWADPPALLPEKAADNLEDTLVSALNPQRALLPILNLLGQIPDAIQSETTEATALGVLRKLQDTVHQGLLRRDYDGLVADLLSFQDEAHHFKCEPALLDLETEVVARMVMEFYSLPPLMFHLQLPYIHWLCELGYPGSASECLLDSHTSWIGAEIARLVEVGMDTTEFVTSVINTTVDILGYGFNKHKDFFGCDVGFSARRTDWISQHIQRLAEQLLTPLVLAGFSGDKSIPICVTLENDAHESEKIPVPQEKTLLRQLPPFYFAVKVVSLCSSRLSELSFALPTISILFSEAMLPVLVHLVRDFTSHVEAKNFGMISIAKEVSAQRVSRNSWDSAERWGELFDEALRSVLLPLHGASYDEWVKPFFSDRIRFGVSSSSVRQGDSVFPCQSWLQKVFVSKATVRLFQQVLALFLPIQVNAPKSKPGGSSLPAQIVSSSLFADVADAGCQQLCRSYLFNLRQIRDVIHSAVLSEFLDHHQNLRPGMVSSYDTNDLPEKTMPITPFSPNSFFSKTDLLLLANASAVCLFSQCIASSFPAHYCGIPPKHLTNLAKKTPNFLYSLVVDVLETRSPLTFSKQSDAKRLLFPDGGGDVLFSDAPNRRLDLILFATPVKSFGLVSPQLDYTTPSSFTILALILSLNIEALFSFISTIGGPLSAIIVCSCSVYILLRNRLLQEAFWREHGGISKSTLKGSEWLQAVDCICQVLSVLVYVAEPFFSSLSNISLLPEDMKQPIVLKNIDEFLNKTLQCPSIVVSTSRVPLLEAQHNISLNPSGRTFTSIRDSIIIGIAQLTQ